MTKEEYAKLWNERSNNLTEIEQECLDSVLLYLQRVLKIQFQNYNHKLKLVKHLFQHILIK